MERTKDTNSKMENKSVTEKLQSRNFLHMFQPEESAAISMLTPVWDCSFELNVNISMITILV